MFKRINVFILVFTLFGLYTVIKGPINSEDLLEVRGILIECKLEKYSERFIRSDKYKPILKLKNGKQYWSSDASNYGVELLNAKAPARIKF